MENNRQLIIECFEFYLKNKNCFDEYIYNCDNYKFNDETNFYYKRFKNKLDINEFINLAFDWDKTPQGFEYWSLLSNKWEDMALNKELFNNFKNRNNTTKKLLRFLKENDCITEYYNKVDLNKFNLLLLKPSDLIVSALTWTATPQGYDFWAKIDNKWRNYLYSLKKATLNNTELLNSSTISNIEIDNNNNISFTFLSR